MYGRSGLDRFKKAQTLEPFSVATGSSAKTTVQSASNAVSQPLVSFPRSQISNQPAQYKNEHQVSRIPVVSDVSTTLSLAQNATQIGGGQSTWQPPDWAIEPRPGVHYLDVLKDGEVLDRINLDKRKHIFGRQFQTCDYVLDHQSVSRQHAAVVPHKNGSVYVIDLGSAHGTFVANERLTKDSPVELEAGQSLRFAASTRVYILRKNEAALFPAPPQLKDISILPPPDPSDEEAVLLYNTFVNRYGLTDSGLESESKQLGNSSSKRQGTQQNEERAAKRLRKIKVAFKDQVGGELVEVVGVSDGADVETEPGPLGVKEGSLVGKYESLVQTTVIPKGKEATSVKEVNPSQKGVTDKLKEVLNKVKNPSKGGIYDDLYGEALPDKVGSSWAYPSASASGRHPSPTKNSETKSLGALTKKTESNSLYDDDENDEDLFG
ncbi:hypothetical protein ACET3Z_001977 [Daucus carota]